MAGALPKQPPPKTNEAESYTFTALPGRIGIGLVDNSEGKVIVSKIASGTQAAECDEMEKGDILVSVAGKSVRGMSRNQVMDLIKAEKRPLEMVFELGDSDDENDD
eukprot:g1627.t1